MSEGPEIHGLMPHRDYPGLSRDWADIDCWSESCVNNSFGECMIPSLATIGEDGRCEGFKPKGLLKIKDEKEQ